MPKPKLEGPEEKAKTADVIESAFRMWLGGFGALATASHEGSKWFDGLVERGREVEKKVVAEGICKRSKPRPDSAPVEQQQPGGEFYRVVPSLDGEVREAAMEVGRVGEALDEVTGDQLLDLGAQIAARHPDLAGRASELRVLLAWEASKRRIVHELAGGPRRVVTAARLQEELEVRIASEAIASIWQEEVLEPREVALALGAGASNREKVSSLRKRSWLLGLRHGRGYLYPAFQIDAARREVYPEVREVNEALGAADDPWGVASWWVSSNDRLGARPADLVGSARAEEVVWAAKAVTAQVG